MGEGFVAGDEDGFVGGLVVVPLEVAHGALDDGAAVFFSAVCFEGEEFCGDGVEVTGEGADEANPVVGEGVVVVAVFVDGDFDDGWFAVAVGSDEGVDDFPELGFCLVDEAVHAVGGVEEEGDLDAIFCVDGWGIDDGFCFFIFAGVWGRFCGHG